MNNEPIEVTDGPGGPVDSRAGEAALEMVDVNFTYPGPNQSALSGVSFKVSAGSTVALVGPSGAGKTTVANLFLRFWDPANGIVKFS